MALPYSRSIPECHLYMTLRPCSCGEMDFRWSQHGLMDTEEGLASIYSGPCGRCGTAREFRFRIPGLMPRPADYFGGPEPSRIIDVSEWHFVATTSASKAIHLIDAGGDRDEVLDALRWAIDGYREALKFIPPGARHAPESAVFTENGRRLLDAGLSGPFDRAVYEGAIERYEEYAAGLR